MCGITGYITKKPTDKNARAFKALLLANEERGGQSAGIYTSANNEITKKAINPFDFIETLDDNILSTSALVLGHTRLATTGAVKDINAHPFRFGNITGVHNGIVNNYKDIMPTARVDSESIFYKLDKTHNNYKKAFKKLAGTFAIAWTDGTGKLYLVRNGNPLAIAYVDGGLFFNSELTTLTAVLYATYGKAIICEELPENAVLVIDKDLHTETHQVNFKYVARYNNYGFYGSDYYGGYGHYVHTDKDDDKKDIDPYNDFNVICDKCGLLDCEDNMYCDDMGQLVYCHKCYQQLNEKQKEKFSLLYDAEYNDDLPLPEPKKVKNGKLQNNKTDLMLYQNKQVGNLL